MPLPVSSPRRQTTLGRQFIFQLTQWHRNSQSSNHFVDCERPNAANLQLTCQLIYPFSCPWQFPILFSQSTFLLQPHFLTLSEVWNQGNQRPLNIWSEWTQSDEITRFNVHTRETGTTERMCANIVLIEWSRCAITFSWAITMPPKFGAEIDVLRLRRANRQCWRFISDPLGQALCINYEP